MILSAIENSISQKIKSVGVPLKDWNINIYRGILTGFNEAFIIDTNKKNQLIEEDSKSAEIIRPILRGRDITRYGYIFANLWVICARYGSYEYISTKYPAIYRHLSLYKNELENRGQCRYTSSGKINTSKPYPGQHHWIELDNNPSKEYLDDFSKQKIVWKRIGSKIRFCYDSNGLLCLDSTCFATGNHIKYLAAVLNTYVGNYLFKDSPKTGTGDLLISVQAFDPVCVPIPTPKQEQSVTDLLDKLLLCADDESVEPLDEALNNYVAEMYGLNEEEKVYIKTYVEKYYR